MKMDHLNRPQNNNATLLGGGFSARVYKGPGGQIVISYAGTDVSSKTGFVADFLSGNVPLATGLYGAQALEAAKLYLQVKADPALAGSPITFTGHSLGGGLASLMAVWFDQPAYVFAAAPFQRSADATQSNPFGPTQAALAQVRAKLTALGLYDAKLFGLGGNDALNGGGSDGAAAGTSRGVSIVPNLGIKYLKSKNSEENKHSSLESIDCLAILNIANEFACLHPLRLQARYRATTSHGGRLRRRYSPFNGMNVLRGFA